MNYSYSLYASHFDTRGYREVQNFFVPSLLSSFKTHTHTHIVQPQKKYMSISYLKVLFFTIMLCLDIGFMEEFVKGEKMERDLQI